MLGFCNDVNICTRRHRVIPYFLSRKKYFYVWTLTSFRFETFPTIIWTRFTNNEGREYVKIFYYSWPLKACSTCVFWNTNENLNFEFSLGVEVFVRLKTRFCFPIFYLMDFFKDWIMQFELCIWELIWNWW